MFGHIVPVEFDPEAGSIAEMHAAVMNLGSELLNLLKQGVIPPVLQDQEIRHRRTGMKVRSQGHGAIRVVGATTTL